MPPFETVTWHLVGWSSVALQAQAIITGVNLNGAGMYAEVRDRPEGGALHFFLTTVADPEDEGIQLEVGFAEDGITPVSTINIRADETTMEAIPTASDLGLEAGSDVPLFWGMHIIPYGGDPPVFAGGTKFMAFDGKFTVKPGVPA